MFNFTLRFLLPSLSLGLSLSLSLRPFLDRQLPLGKSTALHQNINANFFFRHRHKLPQTRFTSANSEPYGWWVATRRGRERGRKSDRVLGKQTDHVDMLICRLPLPHLSNHWKFLCMCDCDVTGAQCVCVGVCVFVCVCKGKQEKRIHNCNEFRLLTHMEMPKRINCCTSLSK